MCAEIMSLLVVDTDSATLSYYMFWYACTLPIHTLLHASAVSSAAALPLSTVLASRVVSSWGDTSQSARVAHTRMMRGGRTDYLALVLFVPRGGGGCARRLLLVHYLGFVSGEFLGGRVTVSARICNVHAVLHVPVLFPPQILNPNPSAPF